MLSQSCSRSGRAVFFSSCFCLCHAVIWTARICRLFLIALSFSFLFQVIPAAAPVVVPVAPMPLARASAASHAAVVMVRSSGDFCSFITYLFPVMLALTVIALLISFRIFVDSFFLFVLPSGDTCGCTDGCTCGPNASCKSKCCKSCTCCDGKNCVALFHSMDEHLLCYMLMSFSVGGIPVLSHRLWHLLTLGPFFFFAPCPVVMFFFLFVCFCCQLQVIPVAALVVAPAAQMRPARASAASRAPAVMVRLLWLS